MVFSSPIFLFCFLPVVLGLYFAAPRRARNAVLLLASVVFYAWGEKQVVLVLLASSAGNYLLARWVARAREQPSARRAVAIAVAGNLGLLVYFKYTNFLADNLNVVLARCGLPGVMVSPVALPAGISFFTFHALSYVIDVHRRDAEPQRAPIELALYMALFPQLIAGPILRYRDVARQLTERVVTPEGFALGVRRFIVGLAKKVLLADTLAVAADGVFGVPAGELGGALAWLGAVAYGLQLYFDFSGYSDMAIGLGRMFGFQFRENFDYPLVSRSVTEFWRRWNISLSTWFRDYLYIPLGGNRCAPWRVYANLWTVFLLCGLWHGARWTFVVWGALHGALMVIERLGFGRVLERAPAALAHGYLLLAFTVTFVVFRADTLHHAAVVVAAMVGLGAPADAARPVSLYWNPAFGLALAVSMVAATPVTSWTRRRWRTLRARVAPRTPLADGAVAAGGVLVLGVLLLACVATLSATTHHPFLYFRF